MPEHLCAPYHRDDYRYLQSVEDEITAGIGDTFSSWTYVQFGSTRETEIEHMIAVAQAHDGGLYMADPEASRSDVPKAAEASP